MRKITTDDIRSIEDAVAANLVQGLSPAVLEKDLHITAALFALANLKVSHNAFHAGSSVRGAQPHSVVVRSHVVFAGGTCLSKGYGLIHRMSEDIDLKIILEEPPAGYRFAKSIGNRKRLGDIHLTVRQALSSLGFIETHIEGTDNPTTRDGRRYYHLSVKYEPVFEDIAGVLRPELKIELIHRHPKLPRVSRPLNNLLHTLVPGAASTPFDIDCIRIEEALSEKVLSLLRRCAFKWSGHQINEMDPALVRHIYDVWKIDTLEPQAKKEAAGIFNALVLTDKQEFERQNPEFDENPIIVLRDTLKTLVTEQRLKEEFEKKLKPLLFSSEAVDYAECLKSFESVANSFLYQ